MEAPWEKVAEADELAPGQLKPVSAGGRCLLLCNADGTLHCVDDLCSHEDFPLHLGCIQEGRIKCSLHGSYFDLETGRPTVEPATDPIAVYPVRVEGGWVWVNPAEGR